MIQPETITLCPICDGNKFLNVLRCEDYTQSRESFNIQKCVTCSLHLTNPRPDQNTIGGYYLSEDYISHTGKTKSVLDYIYFKARNRALKWKEGLIRKKTNGRHLLDFGCGTGEFLNHMAKSGWTVSGVEPSDLARQKANELLGSTKVFASLDSSSSKVDIITMWHVLEHVHNPNQLLTLLKQRLSNDGLIFVAVPNLESRDAQRYEQYWAGYDVPRHLWHFSQTTMKKLLEKNGFQLLETIPMTMDAYYVSLLSEKYKNGGVHNFFTPIKGFISGLRSNQKARASNNYSSLIYLASHA